MLGKYLPGRSIYLKRVMFPLYLRTLGNVRDVEIYDLGCGGGEFLRFCRDRGLRAVGVDSNATLVEACRGSGLTVKQADVTDFDVGGDLRVAVCDNVLEHLTPEENDAFLVNMKTQAAPGARLLVIVPGASGFARDPTHKTFITPAVMQGWIKRHGLPPASLSFAPFNVARLGERFYLNMTVFRITF